MEESHAYITATSATAVDAVDLVKTYRTGRRAQPVRALDGLSLDITAGSVFALLGPNGAGKSTTVKILTTLSRPDAGRASAAGIDVLDQPDDVRRLIDWFTEVVDGSDGDGSGEPRPGRADPGPVARIVAQQSPRTALPLPARRCRQPAREDPLRRDVPEARRRHGADAPAPGVVPDEPTGLDPRHAPRCGPRSAGSRTTST